MKKPDSLLHAAKILAESAGMPWSAVQPYYRALQARDGMDSGSWLPKSVGRNVWNAHPNFITRLIIAIASGSPDEGRSAIGWARYTSPNGRGLYIGEQPYYAGVNALIELEFSKYLTSPEAARDLVNIEFYPDQKNIIFNTKSADPLIFQRTCRVGGTQEDHKIYGTLEALEDFPTQFRGIYHRGVVSGLVFVHISTSINWNTGHIQPFYVADTPSDEE